jgi:riboflavin synthase
MFSGLIAYRGRVAGIERNGASATLRIACQGVSVEQPEPKDSISISGACLTATSVSDGIVSFDVVPETFARTTLGSLQPGDEVNVEYALRVGDRLGGHLVYGHVDTTVRIFGIAEEGQGRRMRLERPAALAQAIVEKGFIAIDGVSLTTAAVGADWFEIALIPETLARTTLGSRKAGDLVNLEIDPLARYVQGR